jgi:MYXO-CTERM domain-containing protein
VCSPGECFSTGFFVPGDGATVPANLPAIYWRPRADIAEAGPENVTLTTLADPATPLAFTATPAGTGRDYLIVPDAALAAGTEYVLTDAGACGFGPTQGGPRATFTVGPAAPLPTSLGTLAITGTQDGTWSLGGTDGSCWVLTDIAGVRVGVDFASTPDAAPWRDVLHFATVVDGAPWTPSEASFAAREPGASWDGRGVDLLHTACAEDGTSWSPMNVADNLSPGAHQVEMHATLPSTDVALATTPIAVTLACPGDEVAGDGAGCCSSTAHPGGVAALVLIVLAFVARRRRRAAIVASSALAAAAVLVGAPRSADACSASCVDSGFFVPGEGATVPANVPGLYWRPRYDSLEPVAPSSVTLSTAADPGTPLAFTATELSSHNYLLVPDAPLVEGTTYLLTDATACMFGGGGNPSPTVTFTVGPTAPMPTTIGTLAVTDLPVRTDAVASAGGSCSLDAVVASAAVAIDYVAVPSAAPWRDVLHFQTYVDGRPWNGRASILGTFAPGASWVGRGFDRLITVCRVDDPFGDENQVGPQLAEGPHQVEMRATLPGTSLAFSTGARTVTLACPTVLPPDGDAGLDGGSGETGEGGGCCSSTTHPGAAAGLAFAVSAWLARRRRAR